jgi:peptidyl-prolyl cis-trans isomerase C
MYNKLLQTALSTVLVASALVLTGCEEEDIPAAPVEEQVDLTQTEDLFAQPLKPNPLTADPDAVVVRVNGEDITRGEIQQVLDMAMRQAAGQIPPQQLQQMQEQMSQRILEDLITKTLLDQAVNDADIEVSEEDLTAAMDKISAGVPPGQDLETALAESGTSLEELTDNVRLQLATSKFFESMTENIPDATEAEAQEYYDANPDRFQRQESVTAQHILIKFDENDSEEVKAEKKAEIEKIRADIIAEAVTFEDAAAAHSDCPSKAQGGSLGTFPKGQMVPEFELAAFSQDVDEIGEVVETQFGYHIIKVSDHMEEGKVSFDEAKDQIIAFLTAQKKQETVQNYIKSLRDSATIEIVSE